MTQNIQISMLLKVQEPVQLYHQCPINIDNWNSQFWYYSPIHCKRKPCVTGKFLFYDDFILVLIQINRQDGHTLSSIQHFSMIFQTQRSILMRNNFKFFWTRHFYIKIYRSVFDLDRLTIARNQVAATLSKCELTVPAFCFALTLRIIELLDVFWYTNGLNFQFTGDLLVHKIQIIPDRNSVLFHF